MIHVEMPATSAASALIRSFAACLASVTETSVEDLPLPPDANLPEILGSWRNWLAEHGAGLVPIANPNRFQWAGWWIAIVPSGESTANPAEVAVLAFGTPPGIVLSPHDPALLGRPTSNFPITAAYAVASLDPVLGPAARMPLQHGTIEALAIAPAAEADMRLIDVVHAHANRGLDGDRYAASAGTFSPLTGHRPGYDLTLIAAETLDGVAAAGNPVDFAATRRNVLTYGIDLNALVGRNFSIGEVLCRGRRPCEPCAHLEHLSGPGLLRPLIHKGGLRADILTNGTIRTGAPIHPAPDDHPSPSVTTDS